MTCEKPDSSSWTCSSMSAVRVLSLSGVAARLGPVGVVYWIVTCPGRLVWGVIDVIVEERWMWDGSNGSVRIRTTVCTPPATTWCRRKRVLQI